MITTIAQAREQTEKRRQRHILEWQNFFRQCWRTAKDERRFESEVRLKLALRYPLSGPDIFEAWARHCAIEAWVSWRIKTYLGVLLRMGLLSETDVLKAVTRRLSYVFAKEVADPDSKKSNPDAGALEHLALRTLDRLRVDNGKSTRGPVAHSIRLFQLIGAFTGAAEARADVLRGPALELGNGLSNYLVAHVNDLLASGVLSIDKGNPPRVLRKAFSSVVPRFIQILESSGSPCKDSLTLLQQQSKLQEEMAEEVQSGTGDLLGAVSFQQNVPDLPISRARASLLAFLSTLLTGRPKADDGNLRTFLNARYQEDVPSLVIDLIVTSFHALAAAVERKDNQEVIVVHRSFLANKLPLVLEEYSPLLFGDKKIDHYIGLALKQVDESHRDTPILQPRTDSDPKQRFLLASALVGLIKESQIPHFLGHVPTQGPPSTRYNKDELVRQCQNDSKRIDQLVGEMGVMEGNTGPIARAFLELIYITCAHQQTMTLQSICNAFLRKPVVLNYMLLFAEPRILLQPLCQLLDNWPAEDPSAEQHHGYDEFGSILLFVLVCRHKFDLPISAFVREPLAADGSPSNSFVLSFLRKGFLPKTPSQLSDTEKQHFNGWIKGLFESNGISDETMSNCSPKDFYLLVATLIDQSLTACQMGVLSMDTVKAGFEFLYEPWLLPSLVPVLSLFSTRLFGVQAETTQVDFLMLVLTLLVKPPKLAAEAKPIHELLLSVIALPLARSLFHVKKLHPRQKEVQPLMELLMKYVRLPATNSMVMSAYSSWLNTKGGLEKVLANAFQDLLAFNTSTKDKQPKYDHRLMYHITLALGAKKTLKILLEQAFKNMGNLKQQEHMIDTLTGVIAANATDAPDGIVALREALQLVVVDVHVLAKKHQSKAEFLVRLNRRVEAHCTKPPEQAPVITSLQDAATDAQQAELDASAAMAAVSAVAATADVKASAGQDIMAGIEQSVNPGDASQLNQMDKMMGMGDADIIFSDFMQDYELLNPQSVEDIFASL